MSGKSPITSTRLNAEDHKKLMEICESTSLKPADIMRLAVDYYFEKVERDGGVVLPVKKKK